MSHGDTVKLHLFSSLKVLPKRALAATTAKRIRAGSFSALNAEEGQGIYGLQSYPHGICFCRCNTVQITWLVGTSALPLLPLRGSPRNAGERVRSAGFCSDFEFPPFPFSLLL